ncbi:LacI family transcriptional regulator [Arthrobacter sp. ZBG10]|uniref:LacI family DNA-binding transcriptional regulator n=1 Tax=Micrococcaceae TaxID=1268 RepID=UPI000681B2AA|nr:MULTISPECIES: LacI family DNA-binding transcriptional regulator [Micrococcaceae]KNH16173.1 LacI family transcriptional regulator [Arthrobacter sp. ZBG10]
MPGIKEVADRAGLSVATVSRALSGKANVSAKSRERARRAAQELGFVPSYHAASLASGRNYNIGLVVPYVQRWYFASVLEGVSETLLDAGYDLTLYNVGEQTERRNSVLSDFLLRKRLDAVIAVALVLSEAEIMQLLAVRRPLVAIGGALPGAASIRIDDARLARLVTEHLIRLGHTRIAHMTGDTELNRDFKLPGIRLSGYQAAMAAAGLPVHPDWQVAADFTIQGAYTAAKRLLGTASERPTAVFAASDEMAVGTILAARDFGLQVPRDISVVGLDGHELGEAFGLTTIDQNPRGQGKLAATTALELLDTAWNSDADAAPIPAPDYEYPTDFVIRTSTAIPPTKP